MLNKLLDYSLLTTVMLTSMGLEVWGLYGLLGLSPFVFIGLVASIFKIVLSRWVGMRPVLLVSVFTFVFAVQSPAISLLNPVQCSMQEQVHKTAQEDTKAYQRNMAHYARMGVQKGEDARIAGLSMLKAKEEHALRAWTACSQSAQNGTWIAIIEVIIIMAVEIVLVLTLGGIKRRYGTAKSVLPLPTTATLPTANGTVSKKMAVAVKDKPWLVLGISERTFYRRQQKQEKK